MPLARLYQRFNNWHVGIVDRTGSMEHFLNIVPKTTVPLFIPSYKATFKDICIERASELVRTGKVLHVFWSGGLDSTCLLAALSFVAPRDQIIVHMTHDSIYESGNLYDEVIHHRFPHYRLLGAPLVDSSKQIDEGLILFGAHGGYVSGLIPDHITEDLLQVPIQSHLDHATYEFYEPFITSFPKPIRTVQDFYYAYFFNFNWNSNSYLFHITFKDAPSKWTSFYDTMEFQNLFISGNECDHTKQCMRNLIRFAWGNKTQEYVNKKKTRPSYTMEFGDWLFITEDNQIITLNDIGVKP